MNSFAKLRKIRISASPGSTPCCLLDAAPHTSRAGPPTATGFAGLHCKPDNREMDGY